jgi:hypothetical protein
MLSRFDAELIVKRPSRDDRFAAAACEVRQRRPHLRQKDVAKLRALGRS